MTTPFRRISLLALRLAAPAVAIVLLTTALVADSRLEFKASEGTAAVVETMFIAHGKVRIDQGKTKSVIIDPKAKLMTALDHDKKEFARFDEKTLEEMGKAWKEGMEAMKDLIASMPPDERGDMEAVLKGLLTLADDFKVVEAGESTVAGKPCRVYRTTVKDLVLNESCFSDIAALKLSRTDRDTLKDAMVLGQDVAQKIAKFISPQLAGQLAPFKSDQVVLRSTNLNNGERTTSEFLRVTTEAIPAELFTVPATYKETKFDGGLVRPPSGTTR